MTDGRQRDVALAARERAIDLARKNFGSLRDLDHDVAMVVWVTAFRACELGIVAERKGGPRGLLKDALVGDGKLSLALREHSIKLDFLNEMVPQIRNLENPRLRTETRQLLIDCLKWKIINAASYSSLRRVLMRAVAAADPLYQQQLPHELTV